jgi:hypothetical protein
MAVIFEIVVFQVVTPCSLIVHPLFSHSLSIPTFIREGIREEMHKIVVGYLLCSHAPLDGCGVVQALVEN